MEKMARLLFCVTVATTCQQLSTPTSSVRTSQPLRNSPAIALSTSAINRCGHHKRPANISSN